MFASFREAPKGRGHWGRCTGQARGVRWRYENFHFLCSHLKLFKFYLGIVYNVDSMCMVFANKVSYLSFRLVWRPNCCQHKAQISQLGQQGPVQTCPVYVLSSWAQDVWCVLWTHQVLPLFFTLNASPNPAPFLPKIQAVPAPNASPASYPVLPKARLLIGCLAAVS